MPTSATKETQASSRQENWAELRYGTVPSLVQKVTQKFQMSKRNKQRKRKISVSKTSRLEKRRGFSYTITTRISFLTVLLLSLNN
jgi:hypothetical protein